MLWIYQGKKKEEGSVEKNVNLWQHITNEDFKFWEDFPEEGTIDLRL